MATTTDRAWDDHRPPDPDPGALAVMRRVKERFDPARIFRPGAFVGGI